MRDAFRESRTPAEWVQKLVNDFGVTREESEIFACAWFAGRYAGVPEVFKVAQRQMNRLEEEKAEKDKEETQRKYPPADGYA